MGTLTYLPTPAERIWIERASAHSAPEDVLQPAARWDHGINDLAVARVMMAIERGTPITRARNGRWHAPTGSPLGPSVSIIVNEMIRVGLVVHHVTGELVPAHVHLMTEFRVSACRVPGENMGPKRVRLHADPVIVDCLACLDRL